MESDDLGTGVTADYIRLKIWGKKPKTSKKSTNKKKNTLNIWKQIGGVRDGFGQKKMMAGFQNDFQGKKVTRYS